MMDDEKKQRKNDATTTSSSSSSRTSTTTSTDDIVNVPPYIIQKWNSILHKEPYSIIIYGLYWSTFFLFVIPIIVVYLYISMIIQLFMWIYKTIITKKKKNSKQQQQNQKDDDDQEIVVDSQIERCILITGCDSGFGKELAIRAASSSSKIFGEYDDDMMIFAGCLHKTQVEKEDIDYHGIKNIQLLQLDVCDDQQVNDAVITIQKWIQHHEEEEEEEEEEGSNVPGGNNNEQKNQNQRRRRRHNNNKRVLYALMNNAGIGSASEIDWMDISQFQKMMDVNYFGIVRCCKAFLPIMKEQSSLGQYKYGRIYNMTSMAGIVPPGIGLAAYAASKHAAYAFSMSLHNELIPWNIHVITITPSFHKTPLVTNHEHIITPPKPTSSSNNNNNTQNDGLLYEQYGEEYMNTFKTLCIYQANQLCWNMNVVVEEILDSLQQNTTTTTTTTNSTSSPHMMIGIDAKFLLILLRMLPTYIYHFLMRIQRRNMIPKQMLMIQKQN